MGNLDGLEPCESLPSCTEGQFIYRTSDTEATDDCTCRYLPQDCPCENQIFDVTTGDCVCEERDCLDDFVWDYDTCKCVCVHDKDCPTDALSEQQYFWDRDSCACQCKPEACDAGYTWNIAACECECNVRTDCPVNTPYFDYDLCECRCAPTQCPKGQEFHFESCQCECSYAECDQPALYYFDTETCACKCRPQECALGFYFNTQECQCLCEDPAIWNDTPCGEGEYFSTTHCECECNPSDPGNVCADGFFLDMESCQCVCDAVVCEDNKIFNDNTCKCECCPKICPDNFYYDDVACECVCTPVSCGSGRYWNSADCRCECTFEECPADENNINYFNTEECACKCSHRVAGKECADGEVFDESICDCVVEPTECADGFHWDARTGQCVCNVEVCPEGQYWRIDTDDSDLCGCYCKPEYCAKGYHWDEDTCDCVCSMPANKGGCEEGQYWDSEHCRCLCSPVECLPVDGVPRRLDDETCECKCYDDGSCPEGQYFDHETCSCVCAPSDECSDNQYWDTRTCSCLADPENCHCAIGFYFDFDEAECRCLPQECKSGLVWNSIDCACECEFDADCEQTVDGVEYFFDADSCSCRCYYKEPTSADNYFDMTDCVEKKKAPEGGCPDVNGHPQYWSVADQECLCAYQRSADPKLVFNVEICDFELAPIDCESDSHYFSPETGMCLCYIQTCPTNHEWNVRMCTCVCMQQECPAGELFDNNCCCCRPCKDQGLCEAGVEFFNPKTCSCTCLPEDCDSPWSWSYSSCQCEPPCSQAQAVQDLYPLSTSLTCADEGASFDIPTCQCIPPTSGTKCDVSSFDYNPFDLECTKATGGIHAIGCEIWINCSTDLDARQIQDQGASVVVTGLPESEANGDICLDDNGFDYLVSKQLMGSSGQVPIDQFYFAEDRNGLGAGNLPIGATPPNFPTEDYIYYLYIQSADRIQWNCTPWLTVGLFECLSDEKRLFVYTSPEEQAAELKIQLHVDPNDIKGGEGECVYWTIEVNSIRGTATPCQGALLDIVTDSTIPGSGTTELYWTRDASFYDDKIDPNPLGALSPHRFRHRFRFDHMEDQGIFVLPEGTTYCQESFNWNPEV